MAEWSGLWTTGGAGDGAVLYSRNDWSKIAKVFAGVMGPEGVAPSLLNGLDGSVLGVNSIQIDTGGALVDGKPYYSDSPVTVVIPSAVGAGNTRIDRIVLRADWTTQEVRILRIAGVDAASPAAPAITQVSGTTYDITLYQALVNVSGTVTLTNEKTMGQISGDDIATGAITNAKYANYSITAMKISQGSIGATEIGTGAIGTSELATGAVESVDIAAGAVNEAALAAGAVTELKAGVRVPSVPKRIGGSSSDWSLAGTTIYTPGLVSIQVGSSSVNGTLVVSFPVAFSGPPIVVAMAEPAYVTASAQSVTASQMTLTNIRHNADPADPHDTSGVAATVWWMAIGPK